MEKQCSSRALSGRAVGLALLAFVLARAERAEAQTTTFTLDRAQLSGAPDDGFMVYRPQMAEETRFYGSFALGYAHAPLRKDALTDSGSAQERMEDPVQGQFLAYPSIGAEVLGRVAFNLHLPFVPYQFTGADPLVAGVGQGGLTDTNAAMGDMRFDTRAKIFETRDRKIRIGAAAFLTFGTGTEDAFGGDRGTTAALFGSAEFDFGSFFVNGHLGPHFKPASGIGGRNGDLVIGDELRYAFGLFVPLRGGRVRLGGELWGSTGIESPGGQNTFFTAENTTFEWLAQGRWLLDKRKRVYFNAGGGTRLSGGYGSADFRLLASIGGFFTLDDTKKDERPKRKIESRPDHYEVDTDGDGYPDGVDHCPNEVEDGKPPNKTDGCPALSDADSDGIPDIHDKCPTEAEDFDKNADDDGCPEVEDSDADGVANEVDACPDEPGLAHADPKVNGCPTMTNLADGKIALLRPVEFERQKATIVPTSTPILDEVVALLRAKPELRVLVEGHTDNVGTAAANQKLSAERAEAVRKYLIDKGIDGARVEAKGIGHERPIASNASAEGRAKNRRVEFVVLGNKTLNADDW